MDQFPLTRGFGGPDNIMNDAGRRVAGKAEFRIQDQAVGHHRHGQLLDMFGRDKNRCRKKSAQALAVFIRVMDALCPAPKVMPLMGPCFAPPG